MDSGKFKKNVEKMQYHRNILTAFSFIVMLSNLMLVILASSKRERIVVVPPTTEKEFWIEGNAYSPAYLEQFGIFLSQLLLNKSPASVDLQNRILLRYVIPEYYPSFKAALIEEMEDMKKQDLSYLFFPKKTQVVPDKKQLILEGDRVVFLGGEELLNETQRYILNFKFENGALLIKELKKVAMKNE